LKVPENAGAVSRSLFDTFVPLYAEYISYGGFPEVVLKSGTETKDRVLEDIFTSYFQMEIVQLSDFRRNDIIRNLILLLMQRIGSKLDVQKLSTELGVSRLTLNDYIAFLESTYFIKRVRPFTKGRDNEIRKAPKIYLCDTGLANHFAKLNAGALFENCVLQNLMTKGEVNYYQKKSGVEIDFIFNKTIAYEVKISPNKSDANKLALLAREAGIEDYRIISGNYSDLGNILYGFMI
jgi:predicted AAA+ superfamily ATPase